MLARYKLHSATLSSSILHQDIANYGRLLPAFTELKERLHLADVGEAERFNMFSIMKFDYYEVLLHSPVLSNLLNPNGSHSQGALFYNKFIEHVYTGVDASLLLNIKPGNLMVENEMWTHLGQIDIFIRHSDPLNPFAIVIENKIYAPDQLKQLERYYEFAQTIYGHTGNIRLLYLKPIKGDPSPESMNVELQKELTEKGVLKSISYKDTIIPWLTDCVTEVKAPVVQHTIQQYIHTLKNICR